MTVLAVAVVGVGDAGRAVGSACQLSPLLPGEAEAVVVTERVPDLVVGDGIPVISGQLILPVTVTVGVRVRCRGRACDSSACLVGIFLGACQVSTKIVAVNESLVKVQIVFPNQLVQAVVVVFLSLHPSFRDRLDVAERVIGVAERLCAERGPACILQGLRLARGHVARVRAVRSLPSPVSAVMRSALSYS